MLTAIGRADVVPRSSLAPRALSSKVTGTTLITTLECCRKPRYEIVDHPLRPTMTDSPLPRIPLDPKEQPILDKLQSIRTQLELLKRDRSTYVKSQDVLTLYDQVIEQVIVLNEIRETKRLEQNKGTCHLLRLISALPHVANNQQLTICSTTASSSYLWPI